MLFHQFGEYFVFYLKFLLQCQYFLFFGPILIFYSFKCPCSMFKKLLLPAIKHRRLQLVLVTNIRYRNFLQQMLPYDVYFFISCIVGLFLTHFLLLFELSNKTDSLHGKFQFTLNQYKKPQTRGPVSQLQKKVPRLMLKRQHLLLRVETSCKDFWITTSKYCTNV